MTDGVHTIRKTDVDALLEAPPEGFVDVPRMIRGGQHHNDFLVLTVHTNTFGNITHYPAENVNKSIAHFVAFSPSIWISSSALNRRLASCSVSVPRLAHNESISSMKIVLGA